MTHLSDKAKKRCYHLDYEYGFFRYIAGLDPKCRGCGALLNTNFLLHELLDREEERMYKVKTVTTKYCNTGCRTARCAGANHERTYHE